MPRSPHGAFRHQTNSVKALRTRRRCPSLRAVLTNGHTGHVPRATGFFFFLRGPNWLWWNKFFKTNYLITFAKTNCKGNPVNSLLPSEGPRSAGGAQGPNAGKDATEDASHAPLTFKTRERHCGAAARQPMSRGCVFVSVIYDRLRQWRTAADDSLNALECQWMGLCVAFHKWYRDPLCVCVCERGSVWSTTTTTTAISTTMNSGLVCHDRRLTEWTKCFKDVIKIGHSLL